MIVLKHNGTIYIARSCWGMRDVEARRTGVPDAENLSIWHPQRRKNRLIATPTAGRFADIIRYENVFPSKLEPKQLILESYDKMTEIAERYGLKEGNFISMRTVFAENDKAYIVYRDGAHIELEDIYSYTCNDEIVMALYDLKGVDDPYEFFKDAFKTIETVNKCVMFPAMVLSTKDNKIKVINR